MKTADVARSFCVSLALGGLTLAGCSQAEPGDGSPSGRPSLTRDQAIPSSGVLASSAEAQELRKLIDAGAFSAAEQMFNRYLEAKPNDACLYAQYARYIVRRYGAGGSGWLSSPIKPDDRYQLAYIFSESMQLATEFDRNLAEPLAAEIAEIMVQEIEKSTQSGGFVTDYSEQLAKNWHTWCVERAPDVCRDLAERMKSVASKCATEGYPYSAVWAANIAADLEYGSSTDEDFPAIVRALQQSAEAGTAKREDLYAAVHEIISLFSDEWPKFQATSEYAWLAAKAAELNLPGIPAPG